MLNPNGSVSGEPPDGDPELTTAEVRLFRRWAKTAEHWKWLWRRILRPAVITVTAMLVAAGPAISALKEIAKWLGLGGGR